MKKKLLALFLLFIVQYSFGQDGSFDISFANNGVNHFSLGNKNTKGDAVLYFSDSSILIAGNSDTNHAGALFARSFYLAKFLSNGTIDNSFGINGSVFFPNGTNGDSYFFSMVKQPDEKILISGTVDGSSVLIRMFPNGVYDPSFGNNGIATITYGNKLALQSNGKIIVSGQYYDGFNNKYSFSRYDSNGILDSTFGINGIAITDVTPFRFDMCTSLLVQPDDKIIAIGDSYDNIAMSAVIVRFDPNGNRDSSFGNYGVLTTPLGASGYGIFYDVGIMQNGKIVAAGIYEYSGGTGGFWGNKPAIVRYNVDGSLDSSFGNNGIVVLNTFFNANDDLWALKLQPNGKILIGGGASYPFPFVLTYFYLYRLNTDGSLDLSFGNNGNVLTNFSNSDINYVHDIEFQQDGKILALGISKNSSTQNNDAVLCRLNNDNILNIESLHREEENFIYPNPSSGNFIVSFSHQISEGEIEIYNLLGHKEFSKGIKGELKKEIHLTNISNGIYFVKVFDGKITYCKKVIIEHD
jgi:uncharacterized delta-60 repeat protein